MQRLKNATVFEKNIEEQNSKNVAQLFQKLSLLYPKRKTKRFQKTI